MKKLFICIFYVGFMAVGLYAQTDSLKTTLIKFLIEKRDLTGDLDSYNRNILIINDILTLEPYDKKETGIYKFGTLASHSYFHLLLKYERNYKILDMQQPIENTFSQIILYFNKNKNYSRDASLAYLEKVIKVYKRNADIVPWKSGN